MVTAVPQKREETRPIYGDVNKDHNSLCHALERQSRGSSPLQVNLRGNDGDTIPPPAGTESEVRNTPSVACLF